MSLWVWWYDASASLCSIIRRLVLSPSIYPQYVECKGIQRLQMAAIHHSYMFSKHS